MLKEQTESTMPVRREGNGQAPATRDAARTLTPPVDIFDTEEGLAVVVDLPGVDKQSVEVHVEKNILTIRGQARSAAKGDPIIREFELLNYFRQFELNEEVDQDRIAADMKYGVLTVRLPKAEAARPKRISVEVKS